MSNDDSLFAMNHVAPLPMFVSSEVIAVPQVVAHLKRAYPDLTVQRSPFESMVVLIDGLAVLLDMGDKPLVAAIKASMRYENRLREREFAKTEERIAQGMYLLMGNFPSCFFSTRTVTDEGVGYTILFPDGERQNIFLPRRDTDYAGQSQTKAIEDFKEFLEEKDFKEFQERKKAKKEQKQ